VGRAFLAAKIEVLKLKIIITTLKMVKNSVKIVKSFRKKTLRNFSEMKCCDFL